MISFDTFFSAIIAIFIFYATMFITLIIAKKTNSTFPTKRIMIVLTVICLLIILVAIALCFNVAPFVQTVVAKIQSIPFIFTKTNFALEDFWLVYLCGVCPFVTFGVIFVSETMEVCISISTKIIEILYNLLATLFIPYFVGSLMYFLLYDFSLLATLIVSLIVEFIICFLLIYVHLFLDEIDWRLP